MNYKKLFEKKIVEGGCCTEILVRFGLALKKSENEEFVKASSALCNGMHTGQVCGALTGGCLILGIFGRNAGAALSPEFVQWFDEEYGMQYGSIDCMDIKSGSSSYMTDICIPMMRQIAGKCVELLSHAGLLE